MVSNDKMPAFKTNCRGRAVYIEYKPRLTVGGITVNYICKVFYECHQ